MEALVSPHGSQRQAAVAVAAKHFDRSVAWKHEYLKWHEPSLLKMTVPSVCISPVITLRNTIFERKDFLVYFTLCFIQISSRDVL
jgi:hypothetical protein